MISSIVTHNLRDFERPELSWPGVSAAAQRIAVRMGLSENRLYADHQEGLLVREQLTYLDKLRTMKIAPAAGLALLDLAPDIEPEPEDRLPAARKTRKPTR